MSNSKNITNFEKHFYGGDKREEEAWRLKIKKELPNTFHGMLAADKNAWYKEKRKLIKGPSILISKHSCIKASLTAETTIDCGKFLSAASCVKAKKSSFFKVTS